MFQRRAYLFFKADQREYQKDLQQKFIKMSQDLAPLLGKAVGRQPYSLRPQYVTCFKLAVCCIVFVCLCLCLCFNKWACKRGKGAFFPGDIVNG